VSNAEKRRLSARTKRFARIGNHRDLQIADISNIAAPEDGRLPKNYQGMDVSCHWPSRQTQPRLV